MKNPWTFEFGIRYSLSSEGDFATKVIHIHYMDDLYLHTITLSKTKTMGHCDLQELS